MKEKEMEELEDILKEQFTLLKLKSKAHKIDYIEKSCGLSNRAKNRVYECAAFDNVLTKAFQAKEQPIAHDYAIVKLAQFLWIYENIYMECVNNVCYLLVCNGHDLLNSYSNEYAETIEQIENVSVSAKLTFLDAHGIKVLKRKEDRDLRNAIAHQHHVIDNGKVKLGKKTIDVHKKSQELMDFTVEYTR